MALSRAAASSGGRRPHTWRRRAVRAAGAVAAGAALSSATPARAAKKAPAASAEPDMIETAMIIGTKFVKECGLSGVVGLAAGMALKSALSLLAVGVAGVFAVGLWLELNGLITIHRDRFGPWLANQTKILDLNNDGVFDAKDVKIAKAKAMGFITQSLPSAGGFATGFMTGLRF